MTSQQLHDALSHLPDDLIEETGRRRNAAKRVIPFRRYAVMAACFALVLASSLFLTRLIQPKGATEAAAQAPAAMMQGKTAKGDDSIAEECAPMEAAADSAAPTEAAGNTATALRARLILHTGGEPQVIRDTDAAHLLELFSQLAYDPQQACNCLAEYRIEQEGEKTWEVNLTEGFVRTAEGQASLTEAQKQTLAEILAAVK